MVCEKPTIIIARARAPQIFLDPSFLNGNKGTHTNIVPPPPPLPPHTHTLMIIRPLALLPVLKLTLVTDLMQLVRAEPLSSGPSVATPIQATSKFVANPNHVRFLDDHPPPPPLLFQLCCPGSLIKTSCWLLKMVNLSKKMMLSADQSMCPALAICHAVLLPIQLVHQNCPTTCTISDHMGHFQVRIMEVPVNQGSDNRGSTVHTFFFL